MQYLLAVALSQIGKPYIWGADHPSIGFDCSGFTQYVYDTVGLSPPQDSTAQGLYDHYMARPGTTVGVVRPGGLAFYGPSLSKITHVAIIIDSFRIIEAAGGDSSFTLLLNDQQAHRKAGVRIRPIKYRKDFLQTLYPSFACIGLI